MKFTIGLPITKTNFLADTLESIAQQSCDDFELIIRNNGSSQETKNKIKSICSGWLSKPNVIYTESEKQLKIADNFNEIVKAAHGNFITILSDDDILYPDFIKEFNHLINKYPGTDVFHCRIRIVNQNKELIHYSELCPEYESLPDFMYHRMIGVRRIFLSDFVVSTNTLKAIGGFPVKSQGWGVDTLTWHLLGNNGIVYTPKILLDYRVNTANFTNNSGNLIIKLEDLAYVKGENERIIRSEEFLNQSGYPEGFLLEKNEEKFRSDAEEVLSDICRANNLIRFYRYYMKYRKSYGFSGKLLAKLVLKKIFLKNF
jgi:glycosyltransferase involved in cell wall biosynthesis